MYNDDDEVLNGFSSIFNHRVFKTMSVIYKYYEILSVSATVSPATTKTILKDFGVASLGLHLAVWHGDP
jgi:hypothetical protein